MVLGIHVDSGVDSAFAPHEKDTAFPEPAVSPVLVVTTLGIFCFTVLTFTPIGPLIGPTALPPVYFGFLIVAVLLYLLLVTWPKSGMSRSIMNCCEKGGIGFEKKYRSRQSGFRSHQTAARAAAHLRSRYAGEAELLEGLEAHWTARPVSLMLELADGEISVPTQDVLRCGALTIDAKSRRVTKGERKFH